MVVKEEEEEEDDEEQHQHQISVLRKLEEAVDTHPDDPSLHFNLGVLLWELKGKESKEKAAEHFVISVKLNPQNGNAFRYLGHYYARVSVDSQRALKCYQRALSLSPDDSDSGESMCDLLDREGKVSLEVAVCREASEKAPRAFWAFRRLGFLQVQQRRWSESVQSLQHAIRGFPTSADLWETLGLAYQRLGMFTAAIKSYGRATELEDTRVFALIESGNIYLMLGSYKKAIEKFQQALQRSPQNTAAHYGLASGLLDLSKECIISGAFKWGASLLELTYAKCFPWMDEDLVPETDEEAFSASILSWKRNCSLAAKCASRSYQRALRLAPWQANIYTDIATALDVIISFKENEKQEMGERLLPEKMIIGGLLLESHNNEFWVALGCLSHHMALKQHAFVRSLQLDVSLAVAWAYLGKLYIKEGKKRLAQQAFDRARSIDPSLALPWAGMSADIYTRDLKPNEAFDCCLRAVQVFPLAEFQLGLAKLALASSHLSSSEAFGAIRQALQHAPHYPESHNLNGLVFEARLDYQSAISSYRLARCAVKSSGGESKSFLRGISINLARSLCKAGKAFDAVQECEDLKKQGALDSEGLHIYALSLWQVGKSDLALSVVRILAASVRSMEPISAAACISFICRMLYYISGRESTITSIVKMPKELFRSSKVSFVVSAIHALDQSNQLEAIVSSGRSSLASHEEIIGMHFLIALSKIVKHGSEYSLGMKNGIDHLRKTLHIYPNSGLLRCLHQEPWKPNVRYLLIVNYLQKAREERFPRHLCSILKRLIGVALANELYSKKDSSVQYQQFQLLLCASEVCLQTGDFIGCVKHAKSASGLAVPNGYLFFAHLLLCRAYASKDSFVSLREEYLRCLKLNTDCHIGLISLKFIQSRYRLLDDASTLELRFEECSKEIKYSWNMWMAIYNLVRSLIAIWDQDFIRAEEFLAQACLLGDAESCIFLCHGFVWVQVPYVWSLPSVSVIQSFYCMLLEVSRRQRALLSPPCPMFIYCWGKQKQVLAPKLSGRQTFVLNGFLGHQSSFFKCICFQCSQKVVWVLHSIMAL